MRTALKALCRLITIAQILLMLTMLVVVNTLVITRYFFSFSAAWSEEATCYSMVWLVMLGAGVLTLFDDHIALYMCVDRLSPRWKDFQRIVAQLVVLGTGVLISWTGIEFAIDHKDVWAAGLQMSMFLPTLAVPVGAIMISLFAFLRLILLISERLGVRLISLPNQSDFMDSSFKSVGEKDHIEEAQHLHQSGEVR